jgi:hypothetical protein
MDGKSFFYVNPLEVWPDNCIPFTDKNHIKPVRQKWFGCACCPPNIARTLASLGEYVCFAEQDALWLNLFAGGTIETSFQGKQVLVTVESRFPYEGSMTVSVQALECAEGEIRIRIPEYAVNPQFSIDGKPVRPSIERGYAVFHQKWERQTIGYTFDMKARFVYANPAVHADIGKVVVMRGPLVYCLEEMDNGPDLAALYVDTEAGLQEEFKTDLLGGTVVVYAEGCRICKNENDPLYMSEKPQKKETKLTFVPYYTWGNRIAGEMAVWVHYI